MKLVRLDAIFDIRYGNSLELNRLSISTKDDGISFVSRKMGNNGIDCYVEKHGDIDPNPAGELTCALSGNGVLSTFIQERPYYTGYHVACLKPKYSLSKSALLFYCACIKANRNKYSYGRQANKTLKELLIPSIDSLPAWVSQISVELPDKTKKPINPEKTALPYPNKWKSFIYRDLFSISRGKGPRKKHWIHR